MNDKKKYELIIIAIFLIGAILSAIFNIYSLIIYLLIGLLIFALYNIQKEKSVEHTERYISKLTNRIKDSSEKGINKFPIGIVVIDENKNIEWANNFISKNIKVADIKGMSILELMPEIKDLFDLETPVDNQFEIFGKHYKVNYQKIAVIYISLILQKVK